MAHMVNHILSKEGILTTFSIAKRISLKDVQCLQKKSKGIKGNNKVNEEKFKKLLKERVMEETHKALVEQKIPGVIVPGHLIPEDEKKRMMELTYVASIISKKISEKKIDKFHSCYIINAIVNMLGLTESDFDDFHKKFSKYKDGGEGTAPTE